MIIPTHDELTAAMDGRPAFIHPDEIAVLCRYASQPDVTRIVEIGCAWGGSSILMLANLSSDAGHLSSVDPFFPDSMGGWQATQAECVQAVYTALARFGALARFKQWSLIPHTSEYVGARWAAPTPIDLLYIDGSHFEEDVESDWSLWAPFVRRGGYILLHDSRRIDGYPDGTFAQGWPAPTELANRLRSDAGWKLVDEVFSMTVWEKLT